MMFKKTLAPGILTVLNLFLGFYSVVLAAQGNFVNAAWFIVLAGVFDVFDGKVARATKAYSSFGEELDSLADVISFGMAPGFLLYQVHFFKIGPLGILLSFFPLLFGALRLARFNANISGHEKLDFSGLPIPASAGLFCSFIIFNFHIWDELFLTSLLMPMVIFISVLMVTTVRFDAMPKFSFKSGGKNKNLLYLLITAVLLIAFFPQLALFPIAIIYITYSLVRSLIRMSKEGLIRNGRKRKKSADDDIEEISDNLDREN
ncbi:MAG: CDP-diacylglycerol--serine O-phosphatidyltransferase [Calditrichaeota bacterium]|nr:MAG: CDP-diacylglycerol--serine O-phosphatidyltransferase [Calditrichota bacterium]